MNELKTLFQNNARWAKQQSETDPLYFPQLAQEQEPDYLWIGCSDSRVPANEIVGLKPGELLVHRNVANIVPHTDFNCLSVLEFGVKVLKVKHVIVCGHYGCGGVKAAMQDRPLGLIDNWLRHIRDVYARHKMELEAISELHSRYDRLVELNVRQQVLNVCHTSIVQEAWSQGQPLHIHGWVYDLHSGRLHDLNYSFSSIDQLEQIYRLLESRG